jgi:beta-phosphoglucomutase-like phosphatase (HAD superfamily)
LSYRAILFDFNGVLIWDAAFQEQSWQCMEGIDLGEQPAIVGSGPMRHTSGRHNTNR